MSELTEIYDLAKSFIGKILAGADPNAFKYLVKKNLNIDEEFPDQVRLFYDFYRSFTPGKRRIIADAIKDLTISHVLSEIGLYNEKLLSTIEELDDLNVGVLDYLERQIERIIKFPVVFEEMIKNERTDPDFPDRRIGRHVHTPSK